MRELTSKQADLMLFMVAFFWGTGFTVTKYALDIFTATQLLFLKFIVAAAVLMVVFWKKMKTAVKADYKAGIIMGVLLAVGYVFQTVGMEGTTSGNAAFLTGSNVVMVPFFYWMATKIKPKKDNTIAAIMMFAGILLLTVDFKNFGKFNYWDLITFMCAILFAWQVVATGIFAADKDPVIIATVQILTCTVIFLVMVVIEGKSMHFNAGGTVSILYLGLINTMLCFLMQTTGQKYTSATHAAIILSLEAVIGSILGVIFLKEKYSFMTILGFAIIFLAVLTAEGGLSLLRRKKI